MSEPKAHSRFSASGSERWLNCPASIALEAASPPSKDSVWSREGTEAHSVLEALLTTNKTPPYTRKEMFEHCFRAAQKIVAIRKAYGGKLLVEKRVYASFIQDDMFGTCDAIIAGDDGTLHIIDFKYGAGHIVNPENNTQLIQYALSVAESYGWELNFHTVKMWILQPRAGANWHKSWSISIEELKKTWLPLWQKGVARVLKGGHEPFPGSYCHWCRARLTCPAKVGAREDKISNVFLNNPLTNEVGNGFEKESGEKESGKKESNKNQKERGRKKESEEENFY